MNRNDFKRLRPNYRLRWLLDGAVVVVHAFPEGEQVEVRHPRLGLIVTHRNNLSALYRHRLRK